MGFAQTVFKRATRRVWVRVMERAGKLVGRWVDTSADAPDYHYAPKRDLYRKIQEKEAQAADAPDDHDHDHGHSHDHGRR
jgi:hypothetical protein